MVAQMWMESTHETRKKLMPRWRGPMRITEVFGTSCALESMGGCPAGGRFNFNRLKHFVPHMSQTELREQLLEQPENAGEPRGR
ncbi:hypothetical protein PUNSTDRAFT_122203 [Punctularia strigosozonata HHB-11173 SS5]|uniref:uncharacterized protein n=1 Tax=Punctularia strigosozonata (strain HHB-11173) TaxID=741275 RepID=UPI0004416C0B|nr:uncharacterized protein PUNSTDRAFT_122203 [Punctularia strigosozonata HHB-11173 SS5]EIN05752.1 hypothetical protein PUNSTDRAFT_122203 [Punctularia strigosozonata HHB-11173 SS5]